MTNPPTYRFSSLQELVDVVPADRIRDCMEELGKTFAVAKAETELITRTAYYLAGKEYPKGTRIIELPPVIEWIDDGKNECEATITLPSGEPVMRMQIAKRAQDNPCP